MKWQHRTIIGFVAYFVFVIALARYSWYRPEQAGLLWVIGLVMAWVVSHFTAASEREAVFN